MEIVFHRGMCVKKHLSGFQCIILRHRPKMMHPAGCSPSAGKSHRDFRQLYMGAYRFRRGCGGRISGQRRLTSIKRVTYKLKNNNEVALAA